MQRQQARGAVRGIKFCVFILLFGVSALKKEVVGSAPSASRFALATQLPPQRCLLTCDHDNALSGGEGLTNIVNQFAVILCKDQQPWPNRRRKVQPAPDHQPPPPPPPPPKQLGERMETALLVWAKSSAAAALACPAKWRKNPMYSSPFLARPVHHAIWKRWTGVRRQSARRLCTPP